MILSYRRGVTVHIILISPANVIIIVFEVSPIYFKFSRLPKQN